MYYELSLISVLIASSYLGVAVIRSGPRMWLYGSILLSTAVAAALGLYRSREHGAAWLGVAGAIGVTAGACLLLVAPLARASARRLANRQWLTIAQRLLEIADLLAPGSGLVTEEKASLATRREIRDGNIEKSLRTLTTARGQADPQGRLLMDERIAILYLAVHRWDEAIAHAEANLFSVVPLAEDVSSPPSLRRALGIGPRLWVELIGAYGYTDNLDRAATMLARLGQVCSGRDDATLWLHRGRLVFLALAGRVTAVEALVAPHASKHMSLGARAYWLAVAHARTGEAGAAGAAYAKARAHSRGGRRVLIDRAIERLGSLQPVDLAPLAKEVVDQIERQAPPVVHLREGRRTPWATRLLTASVLGVAATVALTLGDSSDIGVLVRSGAMVRGFIHDGEWWRVVSCNFVHVGALHLLFNTSGLWLLGRDCEYIFGAARTVVVFAFAGIAGFIASYLASSVPISAGASGAIFGLLGAVFVELTLHRRHYRAAWSRGMWGSLVVIAIAQIGIDFMYSRMTDHYAHAGGALAGALLGAALSPHARWANVSLCASRGMAAVFVAVCAVVAIMVVRTPIAKSFGAPNHEIGILPGLFMSTPRAWKLDDDSLHDPDDLIQVRFLSSNAVNRIDAITRAEEDRVGRRFGRIDISTEHVVSLPPDWDGREFVLSSTEPNGVGGGQRYRLIIAWKQVPTGLIVTSIEVADSIARAAPVLFTALVASVVVR